MQATHANSFTTDPLFSKLRLFLLDLSRAEVKRAQRRKGESVLEVIALKGHTSHEIRRSNPRCCYRVVSVLSHVVPGEETNIMVKTKKAMPGNGSARAIEAILWATADKNEKS
jgi:hypothetical protein